MLYTGKGDDGTTGSFGTKDRVSKSSTLPECLGTLDELNSYLGLCKSKAAQSNRMIGDEKVTSIIHEIQNNLFIVQSEVAGSEKTIGKHKVVRCERLIAEIEEELPKIVSFTIPGGQELSAQFDVARTIARRAERKVVQVHEETLAEVNEHTRQYMNRLSSLLFALARLMNARAGYPLEAPDYEA